MSRILSTQTVIPAKAGIKRVASATHKNQMVRKMTMQSVICRADALLWIPAFAGMTAGVGKVAIHD